MNVFFHRQFMKDRQRIEESGWNMRLLDEFMRSCKNWPLPRAYEAHEMKGQMAGVWDAHIRQNWVVQFRKDSDTILLIRTGTHAMLGIG
ncbi:MAG: type II toxin-antitoxin system mRNA interferase toxin, RelE/StbE family [Candidatus Peregrinibacteria bacterium]